MNNVARKVPDPQKQRVEVDQGFRAWYESCPCCLSEAYPVVKRALDDEKVLRAAAEAAQR